MACASCPFLVRKFATKVRREQGLRRGRFGCVRAEKVEEERKNFPEGLELPRLFLDDCDSTAADAAPSPSSSKKSRSEEEECD